MTDVLKNYSPFRTAQTEKAREDQVHNNAGGAVFQIPLLDRVKRFLILGSSGSYYQSGAEMTKENAEAVIRLAETDADALIDLIVEISESGRAPKAQYGLFALAIAASFSDEAGRKYALQILPRVARTGTHLFLFVSYVQQFRGWGRALRKGIAHWYEDKDVDDLAYQVVKYRKREGWTHADVTHLAHPSKSKTDESFNALLEWVHRGTEDDLLPDLVKGFIEVQAGRISPVEAIKSYRLPWEALPTNALTDPKVWETLLDEGALPYTALIRNLGRMSALGLTKPLSKRLSSIVDYLRNPQAIENSRVHPIQILEAMLTYNQGNGTKGSLTWKAAPEVTWALDDAFRESFKNVTPSGKRTLLAIDCSGSMWWEEGSSMTPAAVASAMALVTVNTERFTHTVTFSAGASSVVPWPVDARASVLQVMDAARAVDFGPTDCALPMLYALDKGLEVDTFIVYTDNETYAGDIHPFQALQQYRKATGIDAKLIVVAMTSTGFSIADPEDPGMLDVAGFDSATPQIISEFSKGI